MYLILDSTNRIAEICKRPRYVRRQKNGVVVLCEQASADAIYSDDSNTFWPLESVAYLCEGHRLVEVDTVPAGVVAGYYFYHAGEFYTTEESLTALVKSEAPTLASIMFVAMAESEQLSNTTISEHAAQFAEWAYPVSYAEKAICKRNGKLYRCMTAHASQESWTPESASSLWKEIGDPTAEWPAWSQPLGSTDTYTHGDKVSHNDKHWTSAYDNNVWEPGVYGWEEVV